MTDKRNPFQTLRENPFEITKGQRVNVTHDLGVEAATVISAGAADPMVTVRFDDGTVSSWLRKFVEVAR